MQDDLIVDQLMAIASSPALLLERARALVESLDWCIPTDATWLTLSDPDSNTYATVGRAGLEQSVLDYLDRPGSGCEVELADLNRGRPPVTVTEFPVPAEELPTWADCLIPAGFREGLTLSLFEPGGPCLGALSLLVAGGEPVSAALRDRVARLAPLIAHGLSPLRSVLATARLVPDASSGVVLLRGGQSYALPGLEDHALLAPSSMVVEIARRTLAAGQVYRSFLWPRTAGPAAIDHVRITVLGATDVPSFVLGTVLVTSDPDCVSLTPRELEVLGFLVEGRSNQQIARKLSIALRTVAAHVEHILCKLDVPTRTLAAVRAEREGCHVPPSPQVAG